MSRTSLNQKIYGPSGEITTINELNEKGLIDFVEEKNFIKSSNLATRIAYFANFKNFDLTDKDHFKGFEISKIAYLSKTNKSKIKEEFR